MPPDLVVTDDIAGAAVAAFVLVAPRVVALAGGDTPRPMYERLAEASYPWGEVDVLFTDERCVPPDHPASNFRMAQEALLSHLAPEGPRVHRLPGEACAAEAADRMVRDALGGRALDLAVLGLGEDGHTASLFPGDAALEERDRAVVRVERPDHPRLTLTLPILSSSRTALFLASGPAKRQAVARLMAEEDIPAARVRAERVTVLADHTAAGRA